MNTKNSSVVSLIAMVLLIVACGGGSNTPNDVDTVISTAEIKPSFTVSITSPESGASFTTTDTIILVGKGNNEEGGVLPASALTWQSDKDGELCQGQSRCAITLSAGSHIITLTGQDSANVTTDAVITVLVTEDTGQLTAGLLAYYPFDGNANDASDNNRHAEIHGAFLTVDRHNAKNSAYQFDGVHSYYIDLKIERSTYPKFSMCAWYQYLGDINADHQTLFSGNTADFWVGKDKGNSNIAVQGGNYNPVAIDTNAWDGEWHHLCYVYDEGAVILYLDNTHVGTANFGQGSGSIRLGKESTSHGLIFKGIIDEVRLYDRALSPADVNVVFVAEDNTGDVLPLLNGTWEELAMQDTWKIKATLDANNAFIDYPLLNCGSYLTFISQTDSVMRFNESLRYGSCIDHGTVELTRISASELTYAWFNPNGVQQSSGSLTPASADNNDSILKVVNWDSRSSVTSDIGDINCGETCSAMLATNTEVVLTAVYDDNSVTPIWVGCLSTNDDTCTVFMNQRRTVMLSLASIKEEIEVNDSFSEAEDIIESTVVTGLLPIDDAFFSYTPINDADFFRFQVEQLGTFKLSSTTAPERLHYILLYDEQQQEITRTRSTAPVIARSLNPGTYYVGVFPYNPEDFAAYIDGTFYTLFTLYWNIRYTLSFSGAVFEAPLTLDSFEENDSLATAKAIETAGSIQGYLDTSNDADFFSFQITEQGTFKISSVHPTHPHDLQLYDEQQQEITKASSTAPTLTLSLSPDTYYVSVSPNNNFNQDIPYILSISKE